MGKQLIILGAGESGTGAALLGQKLDYSVFVSDMGRIRPEYRQALEQAGIPFEEETHRQALGMTEGIVVKSPGIPDSAKVVTRFREAGLPVWSEIEFASRFTQADIVAITGSNGKTTTTHLVHHIFCAAGLDAAIGGNVGNGFAYELFRGDHAHFVLEISSFQLDNIKRFRPRVAVLLNITPDHLDRYQNSVEAYAAAKMRITLNQTPEDYFIYCADDPLTLEALDKHGTNARTLSFSIKKKTGQNAWLEGDQIIFNIHQNQFTMPLRDLTLTGKHNVYNSMAAGIVSRIYEIRKEVIRDSMTNFKGLPHRLEKVATIRGVEFINDSKATNVNSTWYALESIDKPVVWIAGGVDKGNDYQPLKKLVNQKVKAIICLGVDNRHLHEAFSRNVDLMINTQRMEEAVQMAFHLADKGDVVLLSPACASFDLFQNYEDRGNQFKQFVREL